MYRHWLVPRETNVEDAYQMLAVVTAGIGAGVRIWAGLQPSRKGFQFYVRIDLNVT